MIGWRKLAFGAWAFGLTWAFMMWGPEITEKSREHAMILQGTIATAVIGANAYEHRQKRKAANSGAGGAGAPAGPGAAPAADTEGVAAADALPGETEMRQ